MGGEERGGEGRGGEGIHSNAMGWGNDHTDTRQCQSRWNCDRLDRGYGKESQEERGGGRGGGQKEGERKRWDSLYRNEIREVAGEGDHIGQYDSRSKGG